MKSITVHAILLELFGVTVRTHCPPLLPLTRQGKKIDYICLSKIGFFSKLWQLRIRFGNVVEARLSQSIAST